MKIKFPYYRGKYPLINSKGTSGPSPDDCLTWHGGIKWHGDICWHSGEPVEACSELGGFGDFYVENGEGGVVYLTPLEVSGDKNNVLKATLANMAEAMLWPAAATQEMFKINWPATEMKVFQIEHTVLGKWLRDGEDRYEGLSVFIHLLNDVVLSVSARLEYFTLDGTFYQAHMSSGRGGTQYISAATDQPLYIGILGTGAVCLIFDGVASFVRDGELPGTGDLVFLSTNENYQIVVAPFFAKKNPETGAETIIHFNPQDFGILQGLDFGDVPVSKFSHFCKGEPVPVPEPEPEPEPLEPCLGSFGQLPAEFGFPPMTSFSGPNNETIFASEADMKTYLAYSAPLTAAASVLTPFAIDWSATEVRVLRAIVDEPIEVNHDGTDSISMDIQFMDAEQTNSAGVRIHKAAGLNQSDFTLWLDNSNGRYPEYKASDKIETEIYFGIAGNGTVGAIFNGELVAVSEKLDITKDYVVLVTTPTSAPAVYSDGQVTIKLTADQFDSSIKTILTTAGFTTVADLCGNEIED